MKTVYELESEIINIRAEIERTEFNPDELQEDLTYKLAQLEIAQLTPKEQRDLLVHYKLNLTD